MPFLLHSGPEQGDTVNIFASLAIVNAHASSTLAKATLAKATPALTKATPASLAEATSTSAEAAPPLGAAVRSAMRDVHLWRSLGPLRLHGAAGRSD